MSCMVLPNAKEDHFILRSSLLNSLTSPGIPVHRIVPVLKKVGAQLFPKSVLSPHGSCDKKSGQSGTDHSGQHYSTSSMFYAIAILFTTNYKLR